MPKRDALIRENELLRQRLARAESWIRRQVLESHRMIEVSETRKSSRKRFENLLESEIIDTTRARIVEYFGSTLDQAPHGTLDRLLDAEIYWMMLQRFPTIDAFPVVILYQKILDSCIEEYTGAPFRTFALEKKIIGVTPIDGLDRDIERVISRQYTLSLGRLYQFLDESRRDVLDGYYVLMFREFLGEQKKELLMKLMSDDFFLPFASLIALDVFGSKRHEGKVRYVDARKCREVIVGNYQLSGVLKLLLIM